MPTKTKTEPKVKPNTKSHTGRNKLNIAEQMSSSSDDKMSNHKSIREYMLGRDELSYKGHRSFLAVIANTQTNFPDAQNR